MAFRLPGTGPVYEPNWIVKYNKVKADATINRGDIVKTTAENAEPIAMGETAGLALEGYAQALENAIDEDSVQVACVGSIIRGLCEGVISSGQKVKLKVIASGKQTFEPAVAADVPLGSVIGTFLHVEGSPLVTVSKKDDVGVFLLG